MKAIDAWNTIVKKLDGKSDKLVSRRRLQTLPIEFMVTTNGMNLFLIGPMLRGRVVLGREDFEKIYPKFFKASFEKTEEEQIIADCVCTIIDKYCVRHDLRNNLNVDLNGSAE